MQGKKILLIEDDQTQINNITDRLEWIGYIVHSVNTAESGVQAARSEHPDVIVLDISIPGGTASPQLSEEHGFQVLREMRADPMTRTIPIVVFSITANQMEKRIRGLGLGAMWYLLKTAELALGELEATIRRALEFEAQYKPGLSGSQQMALYYDNATGTVWLDGQKTDISLSSYQRKLLDLLFKHHGSICSHSHIEAFVYGASVSPQTIARLVSRLRAKLQDSPQNPRFIKTVRGGGYQLLISDIERYNLPEKELEKGGAMGGQTSP